MHAPERIGGMTAREETDVLVVRCRPGGVGGRGVGGAARASTCVLAGRCGVPARQDLR